jgi:membrane-bound acyltransferase YfiQ involved in biofilm formation
MLPTVNSLCRCICLLAAPDKMRLLNCSELLLVIDATVVSLHDNYVLIFCTTDGSFRLLLLQGNCLFLIVLKHLIVRVYPTGVNSELWPTGWLHKL